MRKLIVLFVVLVAVSYAHGQNRNMIKDKGTMELFTSYFRVSTPLFRAHIPAEACQTIIAQADKIIMSSEELKAVESHDLQMASVNLRVCATSELSRFERDLAVGLHGEVVSEQERRERGGK